MSEVKVDTISERTTDAGVTVEGVKIEDGIATFQTAAGSPLVFEGATADAHETTFAITDPTQDNTITFPDSSFTVPTTGGKILQIVSVPVPEITASTTSTTYVDIAGMTLDITPSATTSNVLIQITMNMIGGNDNVQGVVRLLRDTTPIFIGDQADSNRSRGMFTHRAVSSQSLPNYNAMFYDTAISTTSATTYKLQWATETSETIYLNVASAASDVLKYGTTVSAITLMEIGA